MTTGKKRGPEPGRYRGKANQTGFLLLYADGTTKHVTRLSRVMEATTTNPGNCELRAAYDNRLIATRRFGTWYEPDGTPTANTPDFFTPGSSPTQRQGR